MKTVVLGDIHGRTIWKDIIEKEETFERIIFLGDYLVSHQDISFMDQIDNLKNILSLKKEYPDKVILLRGNHDLDALGYYWAKCSGHSQHLINEMSKYKDEFLNLTQWVYINDDLKTIFSHAGISKIWMNTVAYIDSVYDINKLKPSENFGFVTNNPLDIYGTSPTQPPVWIRPNTLCRYNVKGWDQVIGHTAVNIITNISKSAKYHQNIWLCDSLEFGNYLVIEDKQFIIKNINNNDCKSKEAC